MFEAVNGLLYLIGEMEIGGRRVLDEEFWKLGNLGKSIVEGEDELDEGWLRLYMCCGMVSVCLVVVIL